MKFQKSILVLILLALTIISQFAFSDTSFINNTGGAQIATKDGNISIGTLQSLGKLHINGSVYQNQFMPKIVGSVTDVRLDVARDIYVSGKYAYVAAGFNDSMSIIDISNPLSPSMIGSITDIRLDFAEDVYVSGKYAYVTSSNNDSLTIIDISNASSPAITGSVTDIRLDGAFGVYVSGKYAYVAANSNDSLTIIDIGGIDSPAASIGAVETGSLSVTENAIVGNDFYVGGLNVGPGGLYSQGRVAIYSTNVNNSNVTLLSVGNTTANLVATFGGGAGKIFVGTIDPVYTINGKQYATYMPAMTGVKEETTGTIKMECGSELCASIIDFDSVEEGSDLWLFAKTTNLKKNIDRMTVLLTPSFDGNVWHEINRNDLTIFARTKNIGNPLEISYRLTAPRFDYEKWPNTNNDGVEGFVIDDDS
jgi:hypothetical protein